MQNHLGYKYLVFAQYIKWKYVYKRQNTAFSKADDWYFGIWYVNETKTNQFKSKDIKIKDIFISLKINKSLKK